MAALAAADVATIEAVPGVGPTIAAAVADWFRHDDNRVVVDKLSKPRREHGGSRRGTAPGRSARRQGVCSHRHATDAQALKRVALIEQAGGRVADGVTKTTDTVVAGDEAGSKLEKAEIARNRNHR